MAVDYTTPEGQVRLLISDTTEGAFVFTDLELDAFLAMEGGVVKRAAAQALETLASNEALVSKVIRSQDLSTDGTKVAAELRARAAELRTQAEDDGFDFEVVEFYTYGSPEYVGSEGPFPHEVF